MYVLEYNIQINDDGRPYVYLPEDYDNQIEDRFFALEITRYLLQDTFHRRKYDLDDNTLKHLENSITMLGQISDEMAELLFGEMRRMGDVEIMLNPKYHILVKTIGERDDLPDVSIYYNNKMFDRQDGLKVLVTDEMKIYELTNGITNENWKQI